MAIEIERKFLLKNGEWSIFKEILGKKILQGYLSDNKDKVVRVRIYGDQGFLTIKSSAQGITRSEFEYEIPLTDAEEMLLKMCASVIEKTRYEVMFEGKKWEIDVFGGENEGLMVVELELNSESEEFKKPKWVGDEVTGNLNYYNSNLAIHPFKNWKRD